MAGHKETPRQKMIGMMYLVLTALLALNVSSDLLKAFVIVNEAMIRTNASFKDKNDMLFSEFQKQYSMNKDKVEPYFLKAKKAKELSENLIKLVHETQNKVIGKEQYDNENIKTVKYKSKDPKTGKEIELTASEPRLIPLVDIPNRSNYDKPMEVLLGYGESGTGGEANKIKKAIIQYKKDIADLFSDNKAVKDEFVKTMGLDVEDHWNPNDGKTNNWELNSFFHTPLAADMILLNKVITDVSNIEAEALKLLIQNITRDDFKFDKIAAKVIPKANVVVSGEAYEADIIVAAYSTTESPYVLYKTGIDSLRDEAGTTKISKESGNVVNGVVHYKVPTGGVGPQKYAGVIKITRPDGKEAAYHFNQSYTVIKPTATVSADRMNVVYQELDNPITISAPGFTNDMLTLSVQGGGNLKNLGNGKFEFRPPSGGAVKTVTFSVSGKTTKGTQPLGSYVYRVKGLPAAVTRFGNFKDNDIADKTALLMSPVISCNLDNFLFDGIKYVVTNYTINVVNPKTKMSIVIQNCNGQSVPAEIVNKIRSAPSGSSISISNVRATGPGGKSYLASSLNITLR